MPKLLTKLTIEVELTEEINNEDVVDIVDGGEIEERRFMAMLPSLYKLGYVTEVTLTDAKVSIDTETGNFLRACPCCGKFVTLINDWCDPETCPDADCDLCEEAAVRIRCDEENGGCGYRSPMYHTTVKEAEEYWNTVADSLDEIDKRAYHG